MLSPSGEQSRIFRDPVARQRVNSWSYFRQARDQAHSDAEGGFKGFVEAICKCKLTYKGAAGRDIGWTKSPASWLDNGTRACQRPSLESLCVPETDCSWMNNVLGPRSDEKVGKLRLDAQTTSGPMARGRSLARSSSRVLSESRILK